MSKKFPLFHFLFPQKNIRFFFIKNKLKDTPHSIKKEECLSQQPEGVGGLLGGTHNIGNFRLFTFSFLKRGDFSLFTCLVPLKTFRQQPEGVGGLLGGVHSSESAGPTTPPIHSTPPPAKAAHASVDRFLQVNKNAPTKYKYANTG